MCGLVGYAGQFLPGLVARMNGGQANRGPDGEGVFEDPAADLALGHVRLAILDLSSAAAQPMHSADGRFVLVFNGEIYNFQGLRRDLIARGHGFGSTGDTEVLLHGLVAHGAAFVERLNGIFAFALWDRRDRELLIARDPLGVKPLYYAEPNPGTLLFGSEIKSLLQHPGLSREPDFVALQQHLGYCHASDGRTALRSVKRLLPGCLLRWRKGRALDVQRYWPNPFGRTPLRDRPSELIELRRQLHTATRRQMVADVPVGMFLSGGLDSSLITALAAREANAKFDCFTVAYSSADNRLDRAGEDLPHARDLAQRLGLPLHEIVIEPKVADLWPELVWHLDEPLADPAAIACYLICRLAREQGVKVLLSGQGADELFCGYPRYQVLHATAGLDRLPLAPRRLIARLTRALPGAREGRFGSMLRRVRRVLAELGEPAATRFLNLCASTPQAEISRVWSPAVRDALGTETFRDDCVRHIAETGLTGLSALQERDLAIYLPNHNLNYTDKMSMAVGIEARVPLLDLDLVERVTRYPYPWLLGRDTKVLLREAARGLVPDAIIDRPKAGFGAPYRKWLRYDLADMWHEVTSESAVKGRGWFDYKALQDARARSQSGQDDLYMLQWAVLTMELWARRFID
ncbi:asparagine synthase (glutamine-hydrolyzing) [uncultured Thiodictyon sp.]|uniref:asparagine synthase (glutamine-hydrolyzing) n=1 Tax=uncultured Thiodictyon sp. TaxID=1846217 RepID=UPI0025E421A0|nr:asparagine synthase (glutamine-hydrolyzing) [uncultured Thiodictyon sp.]